MPTESTYPRIQIPQVDIWGIVFERQDRPYPDDKGNGSSRHYTLETADG